MLSTQGLNFSEAFSGDVRMYMPEGGQINPETADILPYVVIVP